MDQAERRGFLITLDNPNKVNDYLITLEALSPDENRRISLRYIPDKLILDSCCFAPYIAALFADMDAPIETLANLLLEDCNNELVARWVQVIMFEDREDQTLHHLVIEDRQPQWDNPHLLGRISQI